MLSSKLPIQETVYFYNPTFNPKQLKQLLKQQKTTTTHTLIGNSIKATKETLSNRNSFLNKPEQFCKGTTLAISDSVDTPTFRTLVTLPDTANTGLRCTFDTILNTLEDDVTSNLYLAQFISRRLINRFRKLF